VPPHYVRTCVKHLDEDQVDGVGGAVRTVGDTLTARAIATAMSCKFGVGNSAFRTTRGVSQLTDTVAFPAYTRAAITRAGPYDEELVRNQDDEYNYRLRSLGARILLAGDVESIYHGRASLRRLCRQYFEYGYWKVRVMQKHPRQMRARQAAPALLVLSLVLGTLLSLLSPLAAYATACRSCRSRSSRCTSPTASASSPASSPSGGAGGASSHVWNRRMDRPDGRRARGRGATGGRAASSWS
jgi:hypothetical protein